MIIKLIFFVGILFFLQACSSSKKISKQNYQAGEFLSVYKARFNSLNNFVATADIRFTFVEDGKTQSNKVQAELYWTKNDSLLIKLTYSIFNVSVAQIFITQNNYVFITRDGLFIRGNNKDNYLEQLLHINIPVKEWGRILFLAQIPFSFNAEQNVDSNLLITIKDSLYTAKFNQSSLIPDKVEMKQGLNNLTEMVYSEFITVSEFSFPKKIVYFNKSLGSETIVDFAEIKVNQFIPSDAFKLKIPYNLEQIIYE